jgi:hypothetical protein
VNRSRLAILLSTIALLGGIGAAVALHQSIVTPPVPLSVPQTYFVGYYPADRLIDLGDLNLNAGEYEISYSFTVNYQGSTPPAKLTCTLEDPNRVVLKFVPNSTRSITSSVLAQRVTFTSNYDVPYVDVGLRCHTTSASSLTAHFSNVKLKARALR